MRRLLNAIDTVAPMIGALLIAVVTVFGVGFVAFAVRSSLYHGVFR